MKLFLDQGVPWRAAQLLRDAGLDAVHAREVGLSAEDDGPILDWCRERGYVVVTLDADFHARLAVSGARGPSVIRVRRQGVKGPEMAALIRAIVTSHHDALEAGAMLTVASGRVRRHALPVTPRRGESAPSETTADTFRAALERELDKGARAGQVTVRVTAGDLHRTVGGYPGRNHRMPLCCQVMSAAMAPGDEVVERPPSGHGASLTIEYRLPRASRG